MDFIDGEDQTEEMCLIAVKQDGLTIQHFAYETPRVSKAAVMQNPNALVYLETKQTNYAR